MKTKLLIIGLCILTLLLIGCGKKVYIDEMYISPNLIKEGSNFSVLFTVVNKELMEGSLNYHYYYDPDCVDTVKGSCSSMGVIHLRRTDSPQPFYTDFYVKEKIPSKCNENKPLLLVLKSECNTISSKQIDYQIAINLEEMDVLP